jgi:hypothetical protein
VRNRHETRYQLKVIHLHRTGGAVERRVSELVFLQGEPRIVWGWIDLGGVRTPIYFAAVDPAKLSRLGVENVFRYDVVTSDPQDAEELTGSRPVREPRNPRTP